MARITNHPDKKTVAYAELWSREYFIAAFWYKATLFAERKGDVYGIGAEYKVDVPGPCYVLVEGGMPSSGARFLRLVGVETGDLENAESPVYPGVNVLAFEAEAPQPEPPTEPEPPTPPLPPSEPPRSFTVYGGGIGSLTRPVVTWWGGDLIFSVPYDWYLEAWEAGPKKLLERLADG
jgi:hypothetical protein